MAETPKQAAQRLSRPMIEKGYQAAALHQYTNADGTIAYCRMRLEHPQGGDKHIRPFKQDGEGYVLGEPIFPGKKLIYRLDLLNQRQDETVFVVEGEKCVDALEKLGLLATTSGGASSAEKADWTPIAGRKVIIWPDNDEAGERYADDVTQQLQALNCDVRRIAVGKLGLLEKGDDCVEWLAANPSATVDDILSLTTTHLKGEVNHWPEPEPLVAKIAPEPYPLDALPEIVQSAIEEVVAFVKAPVPLVASAALGALSLAIQAHVDVKRAEKLDGPVGLFMLTLADSGERKSTVDRLFATAIRQHEEKQAEVSKPELEGYEAAIDVWNAKRDGLLAAIKEATKKAQTTTDLETALETLQSEKPAKPRVERLLLGDETPESLAWTLSQHWPSAGVVSSEAGVIFGAHGMGKDSVMRNMSLLNVLWDGGTHSVGRRTSESFTVRGARLTLALQVQEPTLREFFARCGTLARGTGFLARILVSRPESTQGFRPFTEPPETWPNLSKFNTRIAEILAKEAPMDENGALTPLMLTMDSTAKAAWVDFHDKVESMLVTHGELYDVRDVASKSADNVVRLAALFHVFISKNSNISNSISAECVEAASRIVAWHLNESRRLLGELALPAELLGVVSLDAWLISYCRRERTDLVPIAQLQQRGSNALRRKPVIDAAMLELQEANRARWIHDGKRKTIAVNPALLAEENES